ncbi:hypothetical protein BH09BAC3_BH09BAC3_04970 [soil metagenome]
MKNFDTEYFFRRQVKIWNGEAMQDGVPRKNKVDVQFFAEGGEWVAGFKSKLAFKAIGEDGLARKINGKIVDNEGQSIAEFQSNVLGMGAVAMVPLKGKVYRAMIDDPKMEIVLPSVKDSGDRNTRKRAVAVHYQELVFMNHIAW